MTFLKPIIAAMALTAASAAANAQVFVIGSGLGGECYERTKTPQKFSKTAMDVCTRALQEESMSRKNRAATYVNRGILHMRAGDFDRALNDYAKSRNLIPDLAESFLNEGAAHIYKKDFARALPILDRAIELGSEDIFAAHYNRAIARENTGDIAGAYEDFLKAAELKPDWELVERQLSRFTVEG